MELDEMQRDKGPSSEFEYAPPSAPNDGTATMYGSTQGLVQDKAGPCRDSYSSQASTVRPDPIMVVPRPLA